MLGLTPPPPPPLNFPSKFNPISPILPLQIPNYPSLSITFKKSKPLNPKQFRIHAQNASNDNKNDELRKENGNNGGNGDEEKVGIGRPRLNLKWVDLVLDPDPDNIVAVALTGLLTWASVQVLLQLVIISAAILIAALKYTIVAALLVFILITLL
ncbi:hypothetical protein CDL12_21968 [Handroanthus impetiginosus]|uniref:Transmembrane protein n=1 Tax=Handroanthus impetiginosus TaxID=429701 RepID=A0A2G9GJM7_9LAMI|nr:hypothetical protein CDL12_21968 [Handroanthus impetiginosus]